MLERLKATLQNWLRYARLANHSPSDSVDAAGRWEIPAEVFLINLDRAEYRRRFALSHLSGFGIQPRVFSAVDGRHVSLDQLITDGVYSSEASVEAFSRDLSMPEIGCTLSHIGVYRAIIEEDIPVAMVLEDDTVLDDDFIERVNRVWSALPEDWGIVQLNCDCGEPDRVGPDLVKYSVDRRLPVASSAYLIKREAAEAMVANGIPVRYPADSFLGRAPRWDINVYGSVTPIVTINNVFPTDIQQPHNWVAKVSTAVKRLYLRLVTRGAS